MIEAISILPKRLLVSVETKQAGEKDHKKRDHKSYKHARWRIGLKAWLRICKTVNNASSPYNRSQQTAKCVIWTQIAQHCFWFPATRAAVRLRTTVINFKSTAAAFPQVFEQPIFAALNAFLKLRMVNITLTIAIAAMLAWCRHQLIDYKCSLKRNSKKNLTSAVDRCNTPAKITTVSNQYRLLASR